ncbi:hypothetical protein KAR34_14140, partial [bacterium]|nr:hypothetical protein [bacterium]
IRLLAGFFTHDKPGSPKLKNKIGKYIHREKLQTKEIKQQGALEDKVQEFAVQLGILSKELEAYRCPIRGRERLLRDILIYLIWEKTYYSLNKVGGYFKIGYTAVVNARKRGELYLLENSKFARFVKMID